MNQCLNKILASFESIYEALFSKIIDIFARRGIIRPLIRRPAVPLLELQQNEHSITPEIGVLYQSTSTPIFQKCEQIYRRAESEKEFKRYLIPNLGDSIYKVDTYSRDESMINLFQDKTLDHQLIDKKNNNLQPITESKAEINQPQQFFNQLKQETQENEEQFYSIIDPQIKITQSEQFYSIIDKSSFRHNSLTKYYK